MFTNLSFEKKTKLQKLHRDNIFCSLQIFNCVPEMTIRIITIPFKGIQCNFFERLTTRIIIHENICHKNVSINNEVVNVSYELLYWKLYLVLFFGSDNKYWHTVSCLFYHHPTHSKIYVTFWCLLVAYGVIHKGIFQDL